MTALIITFSLLFPLLTATSIFNFKRRKYKLAIMSAFVAGMNFDVFLYLFNKITIPSNLLVFSNIFILCGIIAINIYQTISNHKTKKELIRVKTRLEAMNVAMEDYSHVLKSTTAYSRWLNELKYERNMDLREIKEKYWKEIIKRP